MNKKLLLGLLVILTVSIGVFGAWKSNLLDGLFGGKNQATIINDGAFALNFQENDGFIATNTSFLLTSNLDLKPEDIKNLISFQPEIKFEVISQNKVTKANQFFPVAKASEETDSSNTGDQLEDSEESNQSQEEDEEVSISRSDEVVQTFMIKPLEEFEKGVTYNLKIESNQGIEVGREYSWAFQTEPDFLVLSSLPRDKGTFVPRNSSIEISFTKDMATDIAKFLSVSPELKYSIETNGRNVVLKHGGMQENTIYEVKIDKGFFEGNKSNFNEDFVFKFETDSEIYNYNQGISFWSDYEEFQPSNNKLFNLGWVSESVEDIQRNYKGKIYRYSNSDNFLKNYQSSKNWDFYWASWYKRNYSNQVQLVGASELFDFDLEVIEKDYSKFLYLQNELENGFYVMEVIDQRDQNKSYVWFQISPVGHYYTYTSQSGLLWLYDFAKKAFVSESQIELVSEIGNFKIGKTDGKGLLQYQTPEALMNNSNSKPSAYKFSYEGQDYISLVKDNYWFGFYYPKASDFWHHISTDRYVYRPTDSINFWGVTKGRVKDIKNDRVNISLEGGNYYYIDMSGYYGENNPLAETNAVVSNYDTISGSLDIKGIEPGYYTLSVRKGSELITSTNIQVVDFSTPTFSIEAIPRKSHVFAGETVEIEVSAKFFDGTPVSNLEVSYNDYISSYDFSEKNLVLDENGVGLLTLVAAKSNNEFDWGGFNNSIYFRSAIEGESDITASTNVMVFDFDKRMQLTSDFKNSSDNKLILNGKINKIDLNKVQQDQRGYFREEFLGDPVANKNVSLSVSGTYYEKIEDGFYYDPIAKTTQTSYRYEFRKDDLGKQQKTTNNNGDFVLEINLNEEQSKKYDSINVEAETTDSRGNTMKVSQSVYRYSRINNDWYGDSSNSPTLSFDTYNENGLSVGEEFKLELIIPEVEGTEYFSENLLFGYQTKISDVVIADSLVFNKKFTEEMKPSFAYQGVVLSNKGFKETNRVFASYNQEDSRLSIEMLTNKDSYKPQEKAEVTVKVKDKDGKPVKAELNIASVDEALFHVLPYEMQRDVLDDLYVDNVDTPSSGSSAVEDKMLQSAMFEAGAEQGGCFVGGTKILMANGTYKNIEDVVAGDQVLSFVSEKANKKEIVTVQATHTYVVDGFYIVNNKLKVTGEHEVFLNGKWDFMGNAQLKDWMIDKSGRKVMIESFEYIKAPKTRVYNLNVDKYHTYFADDFYVHNAEKGGAERSEFKDVTLFKTLETNNNGEAKVDFQIPDNLTSWRITAKAFENQKIQAGQNNVKVSVSLPLFVNVSMNNIYLAEDKPTFTLRAFGRELKNAEVEYTVKSETLGINETVKVNQSTWEYNVPKLELGRHKFSFSVKQGNLTDTLVKEILVLESNTTSYQTKSLVIKDKNDLDVSFANQLESGLVEIIVADSGRGQFSPILFNAKNIVNNRLDHLVARKKSIDVINKSFNQNEEVFNLELGEYYAPEGGSEGLSLLSYSSADLELSALVAAAVPDLVKNTTLIRYFNESLEDEKADIERASIGLFGLASLGDTSALAKAKVLNNNANANTLKGKIYVALTLDKLGDKESARAIYNDIKNQNFKKVQDKLEPVQHDEVSLFVLLGSVIDQTQDVILLKEYLKGFDFEGGFDGLVSVLAIENIVEKFEKSQSEISLTYGDNRKVNFDLSSGYVEYLDLTVDQIKNLKIDSIKGNVNMVFNYKNKSLNQGTSENLSITKKFFVKGVETNEFKIGDLVKIVLDINDSSYSAEVYKNYQISDFVPAGMKVMLSANNDIYNLVVRENGYCGFSWGMKQYQNSVFTNRGSYLFSNNQICNGEDIVYYARVVSRGTYKIEPALIQEVGNLKNQAVSVQSENFIEIK